jgi:hypothetical protein
MLAEKCVYRVPALEPHLTRAFLKRRLARFSSNYDVINIHFVEPIYRRLLGPFRQKARKLVASIWGSEFLRATPAMLADLDRTLSASDIVTTNNPEIRQKLASRFPAIENKLRVVPFGLRSLDVITVIMSKESRNESRRRLALPTNRTIVTIGYNGMRQQQHAIMIAALGALAPQTKARMFALVPMTYPDDPAYQAEVESLLEKSGVEFAVVRNRLDMHDNCRIRIVSDYVVNMQTTDSLSGSLQEHIFAGSRLLVGSWLPYDMVERMGVPLQKVKDARDIASALETSGLNPLGPDRPSYAEKIYQYSNWSTAIGRWIDLYRPVASQA